MAAVTYLATVVTYSCKMCMKFVPGVLEVDAVEVSRVLVVLVLMLSWKDSITLEQHPLKNVNNYCSITYIHSYLLTSG